MGRPRGQIDLGEVYSNFASSLRDVAVIQNTTLSANCRKFGDRLDGSDFAVGGLDRDEFRVRAHGVVQLGRIDEPFAIRLQNRQLDAAFLEPLRGRQHRFVLDRGGDQMIAGGEEIQRDVVRLGRAGREVDFVRLHLEKARDGDARIFDRA